MGRVARSYAHRRAGLARATFLLRAALSWAILLRTASVAAMALGSVLCSGVLVAGGARADGVMTLADGPAGPYRVTVRASPSPLRVGTSQWSVLVRSAPTGDVCLECRVRIELSTTTDGATQALPDPLCTTGHEAERSGSKNRVLHTARIDLGAEGVWAVEVDVDGPRGTGRLDFSASVAPEAPLFAQHGWALAWPAVALALFGLHQTITRRVGPRNRSARAQGS